VFVADEENLAWIVCPGSEDDDALPALREPKRAGVDDSVGPVEPESLEGLRQEAHCRAAIELEHERNVLEEKPAWVSTFDEAEHFGYET
jgi:hypothetical protein